MGSKWEYRENRYRNGKIFHSVVAKLLYVTKRKIPDIEPEVTYFTTRVENSNVDDWKKMRCCTISLKQSKEDKKIIGLRKFFTWVDSSFDVYPNIQSHTEGAMYMGYVIIHCCSSKQTLNTKSTTESEIVDTSKYVPFNIWILFFY